MCIHAIRRASFSCCAKPEGEAGLRSPVLFRKVEVRVFYGRKKASRPGADWRVEIHTWGTGAGSGPDDL